MVRAGRQSLAGASRLQRPAVVGAEAAVTLPTDPLVMVLTELLTCKGEPPNEAGRVRVGGDAFRCFLNESSSKPPESLSRHETFGCQATWHVSLPSSSVHKSSGGEWSEAGSERAHEGADAYTRPWRHEKRPVSTARRARPNCARGTHSRGDLLHTGSSEGGPTGDRCDLGRPRGRGGGGCGAIACRRLLRSGCCNLLREDARCDRFARRRLHRRDEFAFDEARAEGGAQALNELHRRRGLEDLRTLRVRRDACHTRPLQIGGPSSSAQYEHPLAAM